MSGDVRRDAHGYMCPGSCPFAIRVTDAGSVKMYLGSLASSPSLRRRFFTWPTRP